MTLKKTQMNVYVANVLREHAQAEATLENKSLSWLIDKILYERYARR